MTSDKKLLKFMVCFKNLSKSEVPLLFLKITESEELLPFLNTNRFPRMRFILKHSIPSIICD